jgi:integrase
MPELSLAAKKFGNHLKRHTSALHRPSLLNFSKATASALATTAAARAKYRPKMTFGEAAQAHLRNLDDDLSIKPRTRDYWRQRLSALIKSWSGLNETEVRKITQVDCKKWASAYGKKASPTNFNNTIALLRHILNIAVEAGVIYANPALTVKRVPLRGEHVSLPTAAKFNGMITEMRTAYSRDSLNCADFAEGLAFTGCRRGEASEIEWRDLDFGASVLVVRGDSETGTKN